MQNDGRLGGSKVSSKRPASSVAAGSRASGRSGGGADVAGRAAKAPASPTAKQGLRAYARKLAWVLAHDLAQLSAATADRRHLVCEALGLDEEAYDARAAAFERAVRSRHPEVVSRLGCLANDVLAGYASKVAYERAGLHKGRPTAALRGARAAVAAVNASVRRAVLAAAEEPDLPESEAYGCALAVEGGAW